MSNVINKIKSTIKYWYVPAIIGALFIILGIYLFTVPEATYMSLVMMLSLSFLFAGIIETFFAIRNKNSLDGWVWYLVSGLLTLIVGIYLVNSPIAAATTLPLFIGFSLLFRSIQAIGLSIRLKKYGLKNWKNLALLSGFGVLSSILLIAKPAIIGFSLVFLTATSFIIMGIVAILLSVMIKNIID